MPPLVVYRQLGHSLVKRFPQYAKKHPYYHYGKAAYTVGKFLWNNRSKIPNMRNRMRSMVGKRKRKGYSERAEKIPKTNPSVSAFYPSPTLMTSFPNKTFFYDYINFPTTGTGSSQRITEQVMVTGINLCIHVHNVSSYPVWVHICLLQLPNDQMNTLQITNQFFRGENTVINQTQDFEDYAVVPAWDIRYDCNKINPDNKKVISHQKFLLDRQFSVAGQPFGQEQARSILKFEKYFPINKISKFSSSAVSQPEKPFIWGIWYMPCYPGNMSPTAAVNFQVREKLYYKNIT